MGDQLKGKKVLVTGASTGIGRAIALLFAEKGADLCLVAPRAQELSKIANHCKGLGVSALDIPTDITDVRQVERMVHKITSAFKKVDILINNAGYGKYGSFTATPIEEWDRMWNVNVRAVVLITKAIIPIDECCEKWPYC